MFIRYFVELPLPPDRVEGALLTTPEHWLPALAVAVAGRGEGLLAEVGIGPPGRRVGLPVTVRLGDPVRFPSKTLLPMTWKAVKGGSLFPTLDADIEVGPLGPERTQLSINGRYQPPLGRLGRAADRVLLHRVAEATVKDFLDRVTEAVQARTDPTEPPPGERPMPYSPIPGGERR
ncbi:MAG TPA: hypothetical protein VG276_26625 [Actinomycetes bacterium]|jgi:hypothetical protein|nr:hypothetical protein [Actinomycetes bacterium]